MQKFKELFAEYGQVALVMHLLLYACTFVMVFIVIHIGLKDWVLGHAESLLGEKYSQAGTILLTIAVTKLTQPFRLMLLIPLVPFIKQKWDERRHLE